MTQNHTDLPKEVIVTGGEDSITWELRNSPLTEYSGERYSNNMSSDNSASVESDNGHSKGRFQQMSKDDLVNIIMNFEKQKKKEGGLRNESYKKEEREEGNDKIT